MSWLVYGHKFMSHKPNSFTLRLSLNTGCNFVFGSWTWSSGWTWNSLDDSLQTLYLEDGYGFTSGFNVSTSTFSECTITAMAIYDENGEWKPLTIPSEESIITFYKLRGMWHLSWVSYFCVSQLFV